MAINRPQACGNLLIGRLAAPDRRLLLAAAEPVECRRGQVLIEADAVLDAVHFPLTAILAIEERLAGRAGIGVAVVGCDGFVGWPALLGSDRAGHQAVVQCVEGLALRIGRDALAEACRRSEALHTRLLQYVHVVMTQIGHTTASHIEHAIDRRVATWILMRHDRIEGDELDVHHHEIGDALNSRRASVTDALHRLEGEQLIRSRRGWLAVRDRVGLEAFAGEAYGASELLYRRLIGPFGKGVEALAGLSSRRYSSSLAP